MTTQLLDQLKQLNALLDAIKQGTQKSLTPFEYVLLKDYRKSFDSLLNDYEKGVSELRTDTPIGGTFNYRGQQYLVKKTRSQTSWQDAYKLALSCVSPDMQPAIEDTVRVEMTSEVKTAEMLV